MDHGSGSQPFDQQARRALAISLMIQALLILDADGPPVAAAMLSSAIEHAGGVPPTPE